MAIQNAFSRLVVKLGTSTLTGGTAHISLPRLVELVRQIAQLHDNGAEIVVVSSGAIAAGREALGFPQLLKDLPAKQMLAAVGQPRLMAIYENLFSLYSLKTAQVLLTRADLADRRRYLNSRNTLEALLAQRVIPIVNENDTVATEEIRFGDNDNLSALVANLVEADLLVLLTDQAGLFTADPRLDPAAEMIHEIGPEAIPEALWQAAGGSANGLGTGGMTTKLQAADLARQSGVTVVIAPGDAPGVLLDIVAVQGTAAVKGTAAGKTTGTRFQPTGSALESRKRFILAGARASGSLTVDEGAAQALRLGGSLLPVGVRSCSGKFERGDRVRVLGPDGREIARGLVNYAAADLQQILGIRSDKIESILGYAYGDEVIHRNNMVVIEQTSRTKAGDIP